MSEPTQDRTAELLKKVRKIEIKTRGLSNQVFSGGYHSAFKGRGMSFSEVRAYQYGDDVRNIDWNVTARTDAPHIKVFEEEREITVMLLVDISRSTDFGTQLNADGVAQMKKDLMAEISAVLSFSAISNNDKVGVMMFTDQVETFIPPKKGKNHILRIIRELIDPKPEHNGTDLADVLRHLTNMLKKRSVVFVLSDFMNTGPDYKDALSIARGKHDVVGVHIYDDREQELPNMGLARVEDAESGQTAWVDTASAPTREAYAKWYKDHLAQTRQTFLRSGADFLSINTRDSYVQKLMNLFSQRGTRQ
ncbi:DUF58 domain-containing protein [Pontibacter sp. G13]|uniref:DUF58 domain-containing protein n=1 Tax=Pontibacter sp. G13 TaxID=3074898 RepID=UPI00288C359C|nr:DUF58 domain-containing protein [Pontibacter sp. G13]WNJ19909.1 DUF58 domain-containing protein [Pontibacter sp. G13]